MAILHVHRLCDGTFELDKGQLVYAKTPYYGIRVRGELRSLLVETDEGLVLVESGMGDPPENHRKFFRIEDGGVLPSEIEKVGLSVGDVRMVVNTHLHFDHCGWNGHFPNARYVVQRRELEYGRNPHRFQASGYLDQLVNGVEYETVEGEREVWPGIRVIPTPGHTPGHQSVVVEGEMTHVFTGDASPCHENLERRNIPGILFDPVAALESLDRLRSEFWDRDDVVWVHSHVD